MVTLRRLVPAVALVLTLAVPSARSAEADALDGGTKAAIQNVITRQLDALDRGDAKAAEAFAAPAIRDRFPEPAKFLDMVKTNYAALIHPKSTQFVESAPSPEGALQKMTIVAADGTVWSAIYSFERFNGEWRITGCGLAKDETQQDI